MAELIYEFAKIFLDKLTSGAIDIVLVASHIKSKLKDIQKMMATFEVSLLDPTTLQLNDKQIEMLEQLNFVVERMFHFQDERETRTKRRKIISTSNLTQKVLFYVSSSNPIVHAFKDARQFTSIWMNLGSLAREKDEISKLLSKLAKPHKQRNSEFLIESGSYVASGEVIGRDVDRDEILSMLDSPDTLSILPIIGIGGIGKTTLAQYVYSNEGVKSNFDLMVWVCMGQVFNAKEVIRKMVAFATGDRNLHNCEMAQLQNYILPLIRDKRCLIVLDNVWDHRDLSLNWQELMKLFGFGGAWSRFIITTRSDSVARIMSNTNPYRLGDLDPQDSWCLLKKVACRTQPGLELEQIGRRIVELCGNVPLVIRVIGGILREKPTTVVEWSNFRDDLVRQSCCDSESSIMQALKLNYDQLHSKGLKRCFIFWSLFPKDIKMDKYDLIYFWRALGFAETHETAEEYLLCLVNRGLLVEFEDWISMHDVIHDLAISLGKSKYKLINSDKCDIGKETRHVCIKSPSYSTSTSLFQIKDQLQSLFLWNKEFYYGSFIVSTELSEFEHLRILTLPGIRLEKVSSTIGKLIHLRYLDLSENCFTKLPNSITQLVNLLYLELSRCYELKKLPSNVDKLVDLEYLDLWFCISLEELPRSINKLEKLRHLDLEHCHGLKHMPRGIGKLVNLQTLNYYIVNGQSWEDEEVGGLAELASLNNLQGRLRIVVPNWRPLPSEAGGPNLQAKEKLQDLELYFEEGTNADKEMLEGCRPHPNLRSLEIYGYKGDGPPSWFHDTQCFRNLKDPVLDNWKRVSLWGSFERIPLFETLVIRDCENMENIESTNVDAGDVDPNNINANPSNSSSLFRSLLTLEFRDIPNWKWKRWGRIRRWRSSRTAFPKLEKLSFYNVGLEVVPGELQGLPLLKKLDLEFCDQLKEIPKWIDTFTSLEELYIAGCPKLMSLPKQIANLTELRILRITKCPILEERCQRQTGEDWPFICHIPHITFE